MINGAIGGPGGLISAQGTLTSKQDEQQSQVDQAEAQAYAQGLTQSNANAQLVESIIQQLESTSSQIAQSQTQDVSFVRGAS